MSTRYGKVFVTIQGDTSKTPFLTYPDLGLTCKCTIMHKANFFYLYYKFLYIKATTQFHNFFNYVDNEPLMESFCAYHINPLGQEEGAPSLPVKCVVKFEKK